MDLLLRVLMQGIQLYTIFIVVYILMSWFPGARQSSFGEMLGRICEPYLEQFRKIIPPLGMIDISPIVAIIALNFATQGIVVLFGMLGS